MVDASVCTITRSSRTVKTKGLGSRSATPLPGGGFGAQDGLNTPFSIVVLIRVECGLVYEMKSWASSCESTSRMRLDSSVSWTLNRVSKSDSSCGVMSLWKAAIFDRVKRRRMDYRY